MRFLNSSVAIFGRLWPSCAIAITALCRADVCYSAAPNPTTQNTQKVWTPQTISAAESWRESLILNSSWSLTEDLTIVTDNGPKHWETKTADVRCRKGALRYDISIKDFVHPSLGLDHMIQTWDGAISTTLLRKQGADGTILLKASVNGHKPDLLEMTEFLSVLGVQYFGAPFTLSGFIDHALAMKETKANVTSEVIGDSPCVKLTLSNIEGSPGQFDFWFDQSKDCICRKWRWTVPDTPTKNSYDGFDVTRLANMDGLWVPVDAEAFRCKGRKDENQLSCHLTSFSATQPSAQEMEVVFPVGTQVMDSIHKQNYVVGADGTKQYKEFFDVATGMIIRPSTQPTTGPGK